MASQDVSRLWRGATLILQEAARLRAVDFNHRAKSLQHHAADLARVVRQEVGSTAQSSWTVRGSTGASTDTTWENYRPGSQETDSFGPPDLSKPTHDAVSVSADHLRRENVDDTSHVSAASHAATPQHGGSLDKPVQMLADNSSSTLGNSASEKEGSNRSSRANVSAGYVEQVAIAAGLRQQKSTVPLSSVLAGDLAGAATPVPAMAAISRHNEASASVPASVVIPPTLPASGALLHDVTSTPGPASASPGTVIKVIRKKRVFREVAVPASPMARVFGFGSLAASMAFGAAGEAVSRGLGLGGGTVVGPGQGLAIPISEAQAERLAEGLCRMRGAALKIGQMLSLSDETLIPPAVAKVLERVRTQADVMPKKQLEKQMEAELGPDWRKKLGGDAFSDDPVAAASIGQVHRSTLPDGRVVAIKVQYPGVAESIDSDLNNLKRLLNVMNFLPKGLYLDPLIQVAREELTAECNYEREAECQERFRELVKGDADFEVPAVVKELSTRRVLVTTWLNGQPIDAAVDGGLGPEGRTRVARKLLKLTLKELFEWRFMQTDPNWGNFFYDNDRDVIGLLDFGATRSFRKDFVDDYLRLVWAAANNDRQTILDVSIKLGFLTGHESKVMLDAHIDSGLVVGEPFRTHEPFDFKHSGITARVGQHGATFAEHRLTAPPTEVYSLHRKLAGAFLICIRMDAVMPCRDMLEELYRDYKWGPIPEEGIQT